MLSRQSLRAQLLVRYTVVSARYVSTTARPTDSRVRGREGHAHAFVRSKIDGQIPILIPFITFCSSSQQTNSSITVSFGYCCLQSTSHTLHEAATTERSNSFRGSTYHGAKRLSRSRQWRSKGSCSQATALSRGCSLWPLLYAMAIAYAYLSHERKLPEKSECVQSLGSIWT